MDEYKVRFYRDGDTGKEPVWEYLSSLDYKSRTKILKFVEFLRLNQGYLDEPYSRHLEGKIRELRVGFGGKHHRVLYFTFVNRTIILLHAFAKNTDKTPTGEIDRARLNYQNTISNKKFYE